MLEESESSLISRTLQDISSAYPTFKIDNTSSKRMHTCVFISLVAFFILRNNVAVAFQINVDDRVDVRKGRGDFNNGEVDDDDDSFSFSAFGKEKIGDARDIDCISRLFRDYVPPRRLQTDGTTQSTCVILIGACSTT